MVPIPGLFVAPKPVVAAVVPPPPKRPPPPVAAPPPNALVPVPKPVVAGLVPPNSDVVAPPPKGVLAVVAAVLAPKPVLPKPEGPAVAVVEPKRPPPLVVVVVPKAGFAAPKPVPPPNVPLPKPVVPVPPPKSPPVAGWAVVFVPKPVVAGVPKPNHVSHRGSLGRSSRSISGERDGRTGEKGGDGEE